jgi:2-C-methyl-D-erythritol 4-phosphate cytidylyltransferase
MNIALVLSGGTGSRLGGKVPKQYLACDGRMMITRCMETVFSHPSMDAVQIVAADMWRETIVQEMETWIFQQNIALRDKLFGFSDPGETRQLSILSGFRDIDRRAEDDDIVMVHYAARPCLSSRLISDCLAALDGHDGVMPVLPMKDTVYLSRDEKTVSKLLPRSEIFAGQAPEFFRMGKYLQANEALSRDEMLAINGATESAILAGLDVAMVPGDEANFKITTAADMERYLALLEKAQA